MEFRKKMLILDAVFQVTAEDKVIIATIDETHVGFKSLWRMSSGSYKKALQIIAKVAVHYGDTLEWSDSNDFGPDVDFYLGERFGGGCEIESFDEIMILTQEGKIITTD